MNKLPLLPVAGLFALAVSTLSGCASLVEDDAIVSRTSSATGLSPSEFTISDRVDGAGGRTDYQVTTNDGRKFSCYVTGGGMAFSGVVVSDAICSGAGQATGGQCNDLLKAAGKC